MSARDAFLRQARSDFEVFELLQRQPLDSVPECHALHYLQMATEKLARAAFLSLGVLRLDDAPSHVAFSLIPQHLRRRDVAEALGWRDFQRYQAFLRWASPLFRAIDELNPSVGPQLPGGGGQQGPNVEYPWRSRDTDGRLVWHAPADHEFGLLERLRRENNGLVLLHFIRTLLDRFDGVFR